MPRTRRTVSLTPATHELLHVLARETGESARILVARLLLREAQRRNRQRERLRQREADAAAEAERQRTAPRLREFRYDFPPDWSYLHIPAIEHGFQTNDIGIQVFLNTAEKQQSAWPYDLEVTTSHTVKIGLVTHTLASHNAQGALTTLAPHEGGTVFLSGWIPPETSSPEEHI